MHNLFTFFPSYKSISPVSNFGILFVFLLINLASVWILGDIPWLASFPIALSGFLALLYSRSSKLFLTYIIFALAGAFQEIFFISFGIWSYKDTSFFSIPLYLPFIWGNIAILCISFFKGIFMVKPFSLWFHRTPRFFILISALLFAIIFSLVSIFFFWERPFLLFVLFVLIDVFLIYMVRSIPFALVGITALLCGSLGDLVSVATERWSYSVGGTFFGVPPYIFIGWDIVGLLIIAFYLALEAFEKEYLYKKR